MRRVGVSGGQWLRQITPDWIVSQGWSNFVHTERATGVQEELGLGTALHGYVDRTRFRYLRFHVENSREADGLNAFCERVRSGEETCVTFDTSSIWTPSLVDVDVTSIRRRAVAMGSDGLARRWTAIVEGAGGASLATFVSVDEPFHHARLPDELLAQLSAARLFIEPSGEWIVVLAGSTLWRFRQSSTLSFEGVFTLDREPESAILVEGPSFVYATNGSVWQNDFESPETLVTRAGAAPCGEGSVICDPVAMVLAHAPGARPGWVTLAFHAPSAGERVPWAAGHLALVPLRADAPLYTLTRHLTSVRLNGSGWAFSVAWDANAHELMWRSAWDGTLPADTLFAAKLPPEWWSMDR